MLHIKGPMMTTVRYKLEPSIRKGFVQPIMKNEFMCDIPTYHNFDRFVDILDETPEFYKVNIFLKNGSILTCWITKTFFFPLELHNTKTLFDGRFNSYAQG